MSSYAIMTNLGRNKEAASIAAGTALAMAEIAWGDGTRIPAGGETTLENEQGRKAINGNGVLAEALNTAFFEIALSAAEGPFVIREAGLFDTDGDMIAIARFDPPVNKPQNSVTALIRMNVVFSDLENLVLTVEQDNTFVPAIPRQEAIAGNDVLSADLLTLFDVSADTQKQIEVEALAIRMRDLARNGPLLAVPVADNTALDAVVTSSILTAAQGALNPPLAIGGTIEHTELSDGSAMQKAYRITPSGLFLTKHIRARRSGNWSAWTADGPEIGQIVTMAFSSSVPSRLDALGAELSRTSYADLFASVGTAFGIGDGASTFALPATAEKFIRGWDGVSGFALSKEGTWIRTLASEWSGADIPSGGVYTIGTAYAQADDTLNNYGVGQAVPSGAKSAAGAAFNTATTDNFMSGTSLVTSGTANRWIKMAPDHLILKKCIVF